METFGDTHDVDHRSVADIYTNHIEVEIQSSEGKGQTELGSMV